MSNDAYSDKGMRTIYLLWLCVFIVKGHPQPPVSKMSDTGMLHYMFGEAGHVILRLWKNIKERTMTEVRQRLRIINKIFPQLHDSYRKSN